MLTNVVGLLVTPNFTLNHYPYIPKSGILESVKYLLYQSLTLSKSTQLYNIACTIN